MDKKFRERLHWIFAHEPSDESHYFRLVRWLAPSLFTVGGLLFTTYFSHLIGGRVFLLLYPPILLGGIIGGAAPGLVSTGLAVVGLWYWHIPHYYSFQFSGPSDVFGVVTFSLSCLITVAIGAIARFYRIKEHRSHQDVEQARERLELSLDAGRKGAWCWKIQDNYTDLDERTQGILGCDSPRLFGRFPDVVSTFVCEADVKRVALELKRAAVQGGEYDTEFTLKGDSVRVVASHGRVVRDSGGMPVKLVGISWDITDKKQEELLRLSAERRFRTMLESAPDAIVFVDKHGRLNHVNRQAEGLFGRARAELIGMPFNRLVLGLEQSVADRLSRSPGANSTVGVLKDAADVFAVTHTGTRVAIEVALSPLSSGQDGAEFIAVLRDITERQRAEKQLKIFAAVVESSTDFIGISNPDMTPIFVNEAGRAMVGLDSDEAVRNTRVLDYFWPEDRVLAEAEGIPELTQRGRWSRECRFRHFKTGLPIHTQCNCFLIKDQTGQTLAWATINPNLTQLKQTEESLRASLRESNWSGGPT